MDKFGVVIDDDKTKTASTKKTCPACGGPIDGPYCNNCGTKPFEKKPEPKERK